MKKSILLLLFAGLFPFLSGCKMATITDSKVEIADSPHNGYAYVWIGNRGPHDINNMNIYTICYGYGFEGGNPITLPVFVDVSYKLLNDNNDLGMVTNMPLYEGLTYTITCTITQGPNDWVPANNSDTITIKIQTDLAITKIFADSISKNLMITIKNLGTVVVDKKINASCELNPQDPPAGVVGSMKNFTINQQMYPGASSDIDTGLSTTGIYANTWAFCRLLPPYSDSNNGNNDLEIKIK